RGLYPLPAEPAEDLEHHRGLSDPTWPRYQDVVAVGEARRGAPDVALAPDEVGGGHRPAEREVRRGEGSLREWAGHRAKHTSDVYKPRIRRIQVLGCASMGRSPESQQALERAVAAIDRQLAA